MGVVTRLASRVAQRQQLVCHQPRVMVSGPESRTIPSGVAGVDTMLTFACAAKCWLLPFQLSGSSTRGANVDTGRTCRRWLRTRPSCGLRGSLDAQSVATRTWIPHATIESSSATQCSATCIGRDIQIEANRDRVGRREARLCRPPGNRAVCRALSLGTALPSLALGASLAYCYLSTAHADPPPLAHPGTRPIVGDQRGWPATCCRALHGRRLGRGQRHCCGPGPSTGPPKGRRC